MTARKGRPPDRERAGAGATPAPTPNTSRHRDADTQNISGPRPQSNKRAPDGFIGDGDDQLDREWAGQGFRRTFATPRAAEFLERRWLQAQTGQPVQQFGAVVLKELVDNALDAVEAANSDPQLHILTEIRDDALLITVADNGTGIPPHVVDGVLDFSVLVSDKYAYRSLTRGLQGNALKTIVGIPAALGITKPVVIEARGVRHEVAVSLDPGGRVVIRHDQVAGVRTRGTSVTVPLPGWVRVDGARWARAFAICNPHAEIEHAEIEHAHSAEPDTRVSYKPTADQGWRKPLPTDPTSVHWYDVAALTRLVYAHIAHAEAGARDLPLGEFVRQFAGLASTIKAKRVAATVPEVRHLSDLRTAPERIAVLLDAMKDHCTAPKPTRLGGVGEQHYQQLLRQWYGAGRLWFRRKAVVDAAGLPWVFEVVIAETDEPGEVFYAVNYSPTFRDPLADTVLISGETSSAGAESFLRSCDAYPDYHNGLQRAAVIHVICPALEFLDKGKSKLVVPRDVAAEFAAALASATKNLRTEKKARERDARKTARRREQQIAQTRGSQTPLCDAVFEVIDECYAAATGPERYPVSSRTLFYQVRPAIQPVTDKALTQDYFRTLCEDYRRSHDSDPLPQLYYEPRGQLHEPHTGTVVPLGTREVEAYIPPDWTYNKILYVEKKGLHPVLKESGLAERYDMAIITGEGVAATACRDLIAAAAARHWRIFVLRDADPAGYVIAHTLANPTKRMPDHLVEVVDLGLTVADAITHQLPTETFTRRKNLPSTVSFTDTELEWFTGTQIHWGDEPQWRCQRVELNAFTSPGLIAYIEAGLEAHHATDKVIPPDDVLISNAHLAYHAQLRKTADELINELIDRDRLLDTVASELPYQANPGPLREHVTRVLAGNRQLPWTYPAGDDAVATVRCARDQIRSRLAELLTETQPTDGWSG